MSDAQLVRIEKEGRIARIVMEAPPLNALTLPMLDQILAAYRSCAADEGGCC